MGVAAAEVAAEREMGREERNQSGEPVAVGFSLFSFFFFFFSFFFYFFFSFL